MIKPMNVLCTSRASPNSESSLRDSLSMLYNAVSDASTVKRAMVYVMGGKSIPVGELNKLVGCVGNIQRGSINRSWDAILHVVF